MKSPQPCPKCKRLLYLKPDPSIILDPPMRAMGFFCPKHGDVSELIHIRSKE